MRSLPFNLFPVAQLTGEPRRSRQPRPLAEGVLSCVVTLIIVALGSASTGLFAVSLDDEQEENGTPPASAAESSGNASQPAPNYDELIEATLSGLTLPRDFHLSVEIAKEVGEIPLPLAKLRRHLKAFRAALDAILALPDLSHTTHPLRVPRADSVFVRFSFTHGAQATLSAVGDPQGSTSVFCQTNTCRFSQLLRLAGGTRVNFSDIVLRLDSLSDLGPDRESPLKQHELVARYFAALAAEFYAGLSFQLEFPNSIFAPKSDSHAAVIHEHEAHRRVAAALLELTRNRDLAKPPGVRQQLHGMRALHLSLALAARREFIDIMDDVSNWTIPANRGHEPYEVTVTQLPPKTVQAINSMIGISQVTLSNFFHKRHPTNLFRWDDSSIWSLSRKRISFSILTREEWSNWRQNLPTGEVVTFGRDEWFAWFVERDPKTQNQTLRVTYLLEEVLIDSATGRLRPDASTRWARAFAYVHAGLLPPFLRADYYATTELGQGVVQGQMAVEGSRFALRFLRDHNTAGNPLINLAIEQEEKRLTHVMNCRNQLIGAMGN